MTVALRFDKTAVIPISDTVSAEVEAPPGWTLVGVRTPATVTGVALTITSAEKSGGTFLLLKDGAGNSISITMAANQQLGLDPTTHRTLGLRYFKLISGSTELAARTFTLVFAKLYV